MQHEYLHGLPNFLTIRGDTVDVHWTALLKSGEVSCSIPAPPARGVLTGETRSVDGLRLAGRMGSGVFARSIAVASEPQWTSDQKLITDRKDLFFTNEAWEVSDFPQLLAHSTQILKMHHFPLDADPHVTAWAWSQSRLFWCKPYERLGDVPVGEHQYTFEHLRLDPRFQHMWPESSPFSWAYGVWNSLSVLETLSQPALAKAFADPITVRDSIVWQLRGHLDRYRYDEFSSLIDLRFEKKKAVEYTNQKKALWIELQRNIIDAIISARYGVGPRPKKAAELIRVINEDWPVKRTDGLSNAQRREKIEAFLKPKSALNWDSIDPNNRSFLVPSEPTLRTYFKTAGHLSSG